MRKIIAVLLCIIMLATCSGVCVFAATDDSRVDIDDVIPNTIGVSLSSAGEGAGVTAYSEVSLTLSLNTNPGFSVMILSLDHGSENISLKSVTSNVSGVTAEFSNQNGASTVAFYHLGSDCTATGSLATLVFSIGAFSGTATITVSAQEGDICNSNANVVDAEFTNGTIFVSCDHTYVYEGRTETSCSKEGEIRYVCTVCGHIHITYIPKTAHVAKSEWEVISSPDCEHKGIKALRCEYCFEILEQGTIPALGHKYTDDDPIVTKEPTCITEGSKYRDCYVCGYRDVIVIPALGHDGGTWRITYPADCENAGLASRYCNRCDEVLETKEIEKSGQHYTALVVTKQPTCTENGLKEELCVVCGEKISGGETEVIPAIDHTAADEIIVIEPTCSKEGLAEIHCKDCDCLISSRVIPKTEHVKNTLTVVTAPTSTTTGLGKYLCKECGEVVEEVVLPKTDGVFYIETVPTLVGKSAKVDVYIKNNPGFSVGIVRIKYDVASLIFDGVIPGEITEDLTVGVSAVGEITVLISLQKAQYNDNGLVFSLNFTLTENASNGNIELYYNPQNDFSAENGDRVFFNMESGEIPVLQYVRGDCNGDGEVSAGDLAALKLYLAGAAATIGEGADIDENGIVDVGDLAGLKLHLAGAPQF